eukprot:TRINITY_DN7444_c0_g2_i6.p1 TRINITY_DN7444_c0_g2~~TRINITY_DN7444_c0_g2_i6.p1  ORF type:complete len:132 (-),score=35.07 TRINITY_DN7444_c0_g2_i6:11-406(-)
MDIYAEIHPAALHRLKDAHDLGCEIRVGVAPLAVQIHPRRIPAQIPSSSPIGIDEGYDVNRRLLQQIRFGFKLIENSIHPPARHRLAAMLAAEQPDLEPAIADPNSIDTVTEIGRAVQQECRDRSRMPSSA